MDFIEGITLLTFLSRSANKRIPEILALKIFSQIVDSIAYCHSLKIFHRDVKMSNVMLKKKMEVVLIDFGFSVQNPKNDLVNSFCGTLNYIAPELLKNQSFQPGPADVWALGILLFKLITGEYPFKGKVRR